MRTNSKRNIVRYQLFLKANDDTVSPRLRKDLMEATIASHKTHNSVLDYVLTNLRYGTKLSLPESLREEDTGSMLPVVYGDDTTLFPTTELDCYRTSCWEIPEPTDDSPIVSLQQEDAIFVHLEHDAPVMVYINGSLQGFWVTTAESANCTITVAEVEDQPYYGTVYVCHQGVSISNGSLYKSFSQASRALIARMDAFRMRMDVALERMLSQMDAKSFVDDYQGGC